MYIHNLVLFRANVLILRTGHKHMDRVFIGV
jgi:hypothetical protein